jgi:hypothetical protein
MIFQDVVELIDIVTKGLSKEYQFDSLVNLYQSYDYLVKTYDSGVSFTKGAFFHDENLDIYQNTTSFTTPKEKWVYFAKKDLKIFNNSLLKFIRSCSWIDFPETSEEKRFFINNLYRYSAFIPHTKYDNKLQFKNDCSIVEYEYMIFNHIENLCKTIEYDAKNLKENISLVLHKIKEFKEFLDNYFEKNLTPQKMVIEFESDKLIKLNKLITTLHNNHFQEENAKN